VKKKEKKKCGAEKTHNREGGVVRVPYSNALSLRKRKRRQKKKRRKGRNFSEIASQSENGIIVS